jgi:hypothetical protein
MWGMCYHYGVELHNFAPNMISQAATFVGICEGFLGIPVNWDLWVHLFCTELHTLAKSETQVRRVVRAGGLTFALRDLRRELYPLVYDDEQQREVGDGVVLPLQRRHRPPPYTGKVLKAKTDTWHHGVSPPSHRERPESLTDAKQSLADAGLGAASVLTNIHH